MPVHLYGVLDAGLGADAAPPVTGLDGRAVRALALGGRSAWVSDIDEESFLATPRHLREHDAVLGAAVAAGRSVVPARLGRLYADDVAVAAALALGSAVLDAAMALVRGRVEMSLLIAAAASTASAVEDAPNRKATGAGREHLLRIQRQLHGERNLLDAARNLALAIRRALDGIVVAERMVEDPAPPVLVGRAHLIARDDTARYLVAAQRAAATADRALRVAIRGPGAAYSFAVLPSG